MIGTFLRASLVALCGVILFFIATLFVAMTFGVGARWFASLVLAWMGFELTLLGAFKVYLLGSFAGVLCLVGGILAVSDPLSNRVHRFIYRRA